MNLGAGGGGHRPWENEKGNSQVLSLDIIQPVVPLIKHENGCGKADLEKIRVWLGVVLKLQGEVSAGATFLVSAQE